nr:immunoglobulin light chain junction region [Macaca mulatta]
CLHHSSYPLTF